tara:strand:- start:663 stop:1277 length:615 start_codon:yes stop_codon:yes gene_type:complete
MSDIGYIIGNGRSRQQFDLSRLRTTFGKGLVIGCNALYRDWYKDWSLPDYLVAIDEKIINEINKSDYPKDRFIVPPEHEQYEPAEYNPMQPRSNAGMNAMQEAIRKGCNTLYCLGFDFLIADAEQSTSNVYEGTNAYGPETHASYTDSINRTGYLGYFARKNPSVDFYFVFPHTTKDLHPVDATNVRGLYYADFEDLLEKKAAV